MDMALNISALAFRFQGQSADLFEIGQLAVPAGSMLGIRGGSGSGKTTLLHCLAGIEPVRSGSVVWGSTDITQLSPSALTAWRLQNVGLVFQDFHLLEGLSAIDNVLLPTSFTAWHASTALRTRAADLLKRAGISDANRRTEVLSRGERQRVAVARALLFAPPVVLADEPTASLDPENRAIVAQLLCQMAQEHGATLIVVSHDAQLLEKMHQQMELRSGALHMLDESHV